MKNLLLASFFNDFSQTLQQHPYLKYILVGCCLVLILLIIMAVIIGSKKREDENNLNEELSEEKNEDVIEPSFEEEKVLETPVVEEKVEEVPTVEEKEEVIDVPVVEEIKVEESSATEEVKAEETPVVLETPKTRKTPAKKSVAKKEETPVTEEVKVEETPVVLETPKTRKTPAKKQAEKKKEEGKEMTKENETVKTPRVVYGKYEVFTDGTSYFYTLKASNGEVLINSEAYAKKESVLAAIEAIKRNISAGSIVIREDKHGLFQFVLVAKNHRTLVMSANYSTEARAKSASQSFVRFAETSPIVEITEVVETSKELIDTSSAVDKKGGKVGILFDGEGYYYFLKASNGEVLVHSTTYKSETSALAALERFKETVNTGKFYLEKDKRDNYQFKLFSNAGRIVCVGQIYSNKAVAISSAMSVRSFVNLAVTVSE